MLKEGGGGEVGGLSDMLVHPCNLELTYEVVAFYVL